ncbi:MAG: hypothetical protein RBR28_04645 [Lentimicrobium sp.]|jgi:predicted anti-sigma-YlaC factor YlaD|nr:hypothetical protein [Lentimicrobium sp.]
MNCRECENIIFEASAAQLVSTEVKNRLEQHLSLCSHCRQLYIVYAEGMEQLSGGRRSEGDDGLYAKIAAQMQATQHEPVNVRKIIRLSTAFSGAAAAVIVGIFIGNQLINPLSESAFYLRSEVSSAVAYASDDLYQEDAFLLSLESYLSETEKVSE